jgi:hypothetical protein
VKRETEAFAIRQQCSLENKNKNKKQESIQEATERLKRGRDT